MVKNLPASAGDARDEGSVLGLGRSPGGGHGNPLCILAWRIPWMEEPGGLQSIGSQSQTRLKRLYTHTHTPGSNSYWLGNLNKLLNFVLLK